MYALRLLDTIAVSLLVLVVCGSLSGESVGVSGLCPRPAWSLSDERTIGVVL